MRKTLLLVFIHGFKGGDDTFGTFPEHLRALVSHGLPHIDVVVEIYPSFETRGELKECVARFRDWLQNRVIDIEVAHGTPSPTVDPSVHTILIGHSMGGIVAADSFLLLANDQPIPPTTTTSISPETPNYPSNTTMSSATGTSRPNLPQATTSNSGSLMFPHVQGVLAFDTPFLGLAPGMVAHGIEGGHKMASNAYNTYSEVASILGWNSKQEAKAAASATAPNPPLPALPAPNVDAAAAPKWQTWGKYAMFAGAAGAVAAGGAAALYTQREKISAGWGWASGHLLFVGDLVRVELLRKRVENLERACQDRGAGCANLFTNLGRGAREGYGVTATVAGTERTFCNLPNKAKTAQQATNEKAIEPQSNAEVQGMKWVKAINEKAKDETMAHMSMFLPRDNPGFYALGEEAKSFITSWVDESWYSTSDKTTVAGGTVGAGDDGWEEPEVDKDLGSEKEWQGLDGGGDPDHDDDDDLRMRDEDKENIDIDDGMEGSVIVDKAAGGGIPLPATSDKELQV